MDDEAMWRDLTLRTTDLLALEKASWQERDETLSLKGVSVIDFQI